MFDDSQQNLLLMQAAGHDPAPELRRWPLRLDPELPPDSPAQVVVGPTKHGACQTVLFFAANSHILRLVPGLSPSFFKESAHRNHLQS